MKVSLLSSGDGQTMVCSFALGNEEERGGMGQLT